MPALARWAAMLLPMTPAPITPTRRIGFVSAETLKARGGAVLFLVSAAVRKPLTATDHDARERPRQPREFCVAAGLERALRLNRDYPVRSDRVGQSSCKQR